MQCSVFIATSLDGYIARPDGSLDWLDVARLDLHDNGYAKFMATVDVLVIGRGTYDTVLGFEEWPYAGKRCLVLTHRPGTSRHGEEFVSATPVEIVARLAQGGANRTYVDGGVVVRQFLDAKLIDDLTISVMPILLGAGIPLFAPRVTEQRLALEELTSWPTGVVQMRYSRIPDGRP
jgi:dihydrofolate reductase